jgi:hypothetical protein
MNTSVNRPTARARGRAKNRERPLGVAVGLALAATLAVGLVLLVAQLLWPGSVVRNFFLMSLHASSATLPLDPLYQQYKEALNRQEALLDSPLAFGCGGLVLGLLAPRYAACGRVLITSALMALGLLVVLLGFTWIDALHNTNALADNEGGRVARLGAPLDYVLRQTAWGLGWTAVCMGGAWVGMRARDRRMTPSTPAAASGRIKTP